MSFVKFFSKEIVDRHLTYNELLPAVKKSLMEFSSRESDQPRRIVLWMEQNRRQFIMPSYSNWENVLSTKLLTIFPDCGERNLPVRNSYLLLFSEEDGTLKCLFDSEPISWKRTAAASTVATQAIIKDDPKVLGVLGSGNQATAHIVAFSTVYKFEQIKVWSRNPENVSKIVATMKDLPITPCLTAEKAVRDADVVVTATSSATPVLLGKWLKTGCHVNVVGAIKPNWRETDDDCMNDAVVYTDSIEAAEHESGDIILSKAPIYAEIGDLLLGKKVPKYGRLTLYKSTGIAIEDAYAAKLVWNSLQRTQGDETS